jgi:hypothetical protein
VNLELHREALEIARDKLAILHRQKSVLERSFAHFLTFENKLKKTSFDPNKFRKSKQIEKLSKEIESLTRKIEFFEKKYELNI